MSKTTDKKVRDFRAAKIHSKAANNYFNSNNEEKAIYHYKIALPLLCQSYEDNPTEAAPLIAGACHNFGVICSKNENKSEEALKLLKIALKVYSDLSVFDSERYEPDLAATCFLIAEIYSENNMYDLAETLYRDALIIYRRFSKADFKKYGQCLADTCCSLATICFDNLHKKAEAEELTRECLAAQRAIAPDKVEAYQLIIASSLYKLGFICSNIGKHAEAEASFREALALRIKFVRTSPKVVLAQIAATCNSLGALYNKTERENKAKKMFVTALRIYCKLSESEPEHFMPYVAEICHNLSIIYRKKMDFKKAKTFVENTMQIAKKYEHTSSLCKKLCIIHG